MSGGARYSNPRQALLLVFLMLLLPIASQTQAIDNTPEVEEPTHSPPILVEGLPPLMCGEELCDRPLRMYDRDGRDANMEYGWWQAYGPDLDWNGMDDRLQRVMSGLDSMSPTAIIGPDGRKTVAIVVDYAWYPAEQELNILVSTLEKHGWVGAKGGAFFEVIESIDAIAVDKVPVSALMDIYHLDGVVVIEMQNVMVPSNDVASRAALARPSEEYSYTAHDQGYTGSGVIIAVLDTGVDNEHRSLNDFDDENDAPDGDATSYSDRKWIAGYDATSQNPDDSGNTDPDDGNGHGTHVAGSALGTGDASKVHMGTAPGAGLIDIKVLTDGGGTNSQFSLRGLQWMINNVNTDWGVNSTYTGIQIASMSYGSLGGGPLLPGDQGDNGSSAEANLVNQATEAGIVCVVAIGNDGTNRVPSPGSADGAITIGSVNDNNSVLRTDDKMSDFSNYGPRISDNDDDDLDEQKPDVTSYGSNIMSATYAASFGLPGTGVTLADDQYDSKSGTSMATPIASGVIALILEADPTLTPEEVKEIVQLSSEPRGEPAEAQLSRWNETFGYGIVDASCAIAFIRGTICDNGLRASTSDVNISFPVNGTWVMANTFTRISGDVNTTEVDYNKVEIKVEQRFTFRDNNGDGKNDKPPKTLLDWTEANGSMSYWFYDLELQNSWVESDDEFIIVYGVATDVDGNESNLAIRTFQLSRTGINIDTPISRNVLSGTVDVSGSVEGVEHDRIEYKVEDGEWETGTTLSKHSGPGEDGSDSWTFSWDTSEVEDGFHEFYVRMVNKTGFESPIFSRSFTIDNVPPAPSLRFQGDVEIFDQKLPAETAYAGSLLEVKFEVYNAGDKAANDIFVRLTAPGEESEVYPSQGIIPSLEKGESVGVTLFWQASVAGLHEVKIELDPNNVQGDLEPEDNVFTFPFEILERPSQSVIRYLPGAVTTLPNIPLADEDYTINVRVDNLGQSNAVSLDMVLEYRIMGSLDTGWQLLDEKRIAFVPGANIESGSEYASFTHRNKEVGVVHYRATLTGDGIESEFSQHTFTVVISDVSSGQGSATLSLSEDEYPVAFAGIESSTLLFTTVDGELHVRSLNKKLELLTDTLVDQNWGGEIDVLARDDGLVHAVWTSRTQSQQGYYLNDVAMTSFSSTGQMLPIHHHLTPLKISEGEYWGLDLAQDDDIIVLSGYFRNISTGGSWSDMTSVFSIHSTSPDVGENWTDMRTHIPVIDIHPDKGDQLSTLLLDGVLHVLYQELRDDVTGIERSGLMYSRGELDSSLWSYQSSIGDEASSAQLGVLTNKDETFFFAAWIEGSGGDANIAVLATEGSWSEDVERTSAPGATTLLFNERSEIIEVIYDEITVHGEVTRYGILTIQETNDGGMSLVGLGNIVSEKKSLLGYSMNEQDSILFTVSPTGRFSMEKFLMDPEQDEGEPKSLLEQLLEPLPGSDKTKVRIFFGLVSVLFIIFVMVVISLRSSRKEDDTLDALEVEEDEIAILVQVEDDEAEEELVATVPVSAPVQVEMEEPTLSDELEAKSIAGEGNARLNRRMKRKQDREIAEIVSKGLPPMPTPIPQPEIPDAEIVPSLPVAEFEQGSLPPLAELPPLRRQAVCPSCKANFPVTDLMRAQVKCPICSEEFNL
ncbi:MAG: Serine protease AprX [Euryarchaeota archaeon UBA443]|nr:MAG: Serine protease AprX [Euryarchaeota archaeon UBA443]